MGFDSERDFAPPTVLLGLLLCPCTWDISSKSLQHRCSCWSSAYRLAEASLPMDMGYLLTVAPAPSSRRGVSSSQEVDNWDIQGQGDLLNIPLRFEKSCHLNLPRR
ncbi:unnamed protein product [Rangifer tarandus platyrhynchus]|uniref:Uncharacterized protein n=1 Tax=Rangifer tarandus platyrhynchus TaxID=3082113 RepID=A0AC59ZSZ9_RANTA